jgi:hypothetical protein
MHRNINHSRAIVAYLDNHHEQYIMFKIFLNSLELIDVEDTDIVIFYNPSYAKYFDNYLNSIYIGKNQARLILIEMESLTTIDKDFHDYPFINSIACLLNQEWLLQYSYILKTDLDVVLTPNWNSHYPQGFETGLGAYNNDFNTKQKLNDVVERLKLKINGKYNYNIGSSWYGSSDKILSVAQLTVKICREFLLNEFKNFVGEWPGFFRGVTSLYASEIAINYLIDNINYNNIDIDSDSNSLKINATHIHFIHCDIMFSKHAFLEGKYTDVDPNSLNTDIINQYCLFCALTSV